MIVQLESGVLLNLNNILYVNPKKLTVVFIKGTSFSISKKDIHRIKVAGCKK